MAHHFARRVITPNCQDPVRNAIQVIVWTALPPIAYETHWALAVELSDLVVDAVLDFSAVVVAGDQAGVGEPAAGGTIFCVAILAWTTVEATLEAKRTLCGSKLAIVS